MTRRSRLALLRWTLCALVVAWFLRPAAAEAHQVGLSRGEYLLTGGRLEIELGFAHRDLATAFPALDSNGDGELDAAEVAAGYGTVDRDILGALQITSGGRPCPVQRTVAAIMDEDAVLRGYAVCPGGAPDLPLVFGFLRALPAGHRHLAHVRAGAAEQETIALHSKNTVRVDTGHPIEGSSDGVGAFVRLGIEHILTGYDHLVFLFALVLIGGRPRALVKAITAFTLAHSLSLALAVLGVWAPSPRFVEPAIALSIAYVGLENFVVKDPDKRWRITLPFGFVHGFGFAGALIERHLPRPRIPLALLGFNAGVEVGQLAVLALVLPLVLVARRSQLVRERVVPVANVIVVLLGLGWLALRIRDAVR
ncbi:MAG TPA: HupE/UreJ family protein [Labilithrix sp.]|nr:HupE/UreJ family protein [Labilithrix sp.]